MNKTNLSENCLSLVGAWEILFTDIGVLSLLWSNVLISVYSIIVWQYISWLYHRVISFLVAPVIENGIEVKQSVSLQHFLTSKILLTEYHSVMYAQKGFFVSVTVWNQWRKSCSQAPSVTLFPLCSLWQFVKPVQTSVLSLRMSLILTHCTVPQTIQ